MIKVIVTDDQEIMRLGITKTLENVRGIECKDQAVDGNDLLKQLKTKKFNVVLLDLSMPGKHGLEVLEIIKRDYPDISVIVLTVFEEDKYGVRALQSGAKGFLNKDVKKDELVQAIKSVFLGKHYIKDTLSEKMLTMLNNDQTPHVQLSNRELEVLTLITKGVKLSEIAVKLCISQKTVSTYRSRILEKLDVSTNAALIKYAISNNLVEL